MNININNRVFDLNKDLTILDSLKENGVLLNHDCIDGRCRSCKSKLIEGDIHESDPYNVLSLNEKKNGYFLACVTKPKTSLKIKSEIIDPEKIVDVINFPGKINKINYLKNNILILDIRIPPSIKLSFLKGQYLKIKLKGFERSYSIADFDEENNILSFFIKNYGGEMSKLLFSKINVNDLVHLEGPYGTFYIRDDFSKNLIFLATGTGIAPIKMMIYELVNDKKVNPKKINLFWGNRYVKDFFIPDNYFLDLGINYFKTCSREDNLTGSEFSDSYVQNLMIEKIVSLSNFYIYACGNINMISDSYEKSKKNGLSEYSFFSDAFIKS